MRRWGGLGAVASERRSQPADAAWVDGLGGVPGAARPAGADLYRDQDAVWRQGNEVNLALEHPPAASKDPPAAGA